MIFESRFTNFLKARFPHAHYDGLREMAAKIQVTKSFFDSSIQPSEFVMPSHKDMAAVVITRQLEEDSGSPFTNSLLVDAFGFVDDGASVESSQQDASQTGEASHLEQTFTAAQEHFLAKYRNPEALTGATGGFRLMQAASLRGDQVSFNEARAELRRLENGDVTQIAGVNGVTSLDGMYHVADKDNEVFESVKADAYTCIGDLATFYNIATLEPQATATEITVKADSSSQHT